jgi:Dyp-type peroxidase family
MTSLHELTEPIYHGTLKSLQEHPQKPLESLQGNILNGHGRDRSVHIFLKFKDSKGSDVKRWIKGLAEAQRITSAQRQLEETEQYRRDKTPGSLFMNFFLSAKGYEYLYPEQKSNLRFDDEAFLCGMKAAQHRLNDLPKEAWEEGYRNDIHAMVLLADDDELHLQQEADKLCNDVKARTESEICMVEYGRVMWNRQNYPQEYPVEHFGYVDSRSQPLFFQSEIERESLERDGTNVWDPGAGPNLVLVQDPYGRNGCDSGSYLVFRKLEQHVRAFKEYEQQFAQALGLTGEDVKRAGALVMGRFEDGTPVVLKGTQGQSDPVPNNFTYDADPEGRKCPLQAHIRKVNPRQKDGPCIVRRGITYGKREKEPQDNPSLEELPLGGVGLLFMCYQKSIVQQFEVLQYLYANDPRFPGEREPGIDPIIGQPGGNGVGQLKWPARWNDPREQHKPFDFHSFVTLKGGEYFFAPSIHFLKNIEQEIS